MFFIGLPSSIVSISISNRSVLSFSITVSIYAFPFTISWGFAISYKFLLFNSPIYIPYIPFISFKYIFPIISLLLMVEFFSPVVPA